MAIYEWGSHNFVYSAIFIFAGVVMLARGFSSALAGKFAGPVERVALPAAWPELGVAAWYVSPLVAQVLLARGAAFDMQGGLAYVDDRVLIGAAGKSFAFSSPGAFDMWASINRARVVREIELANGMEAGRRAVWVAEKREKLEAYAEKVMRAAARIAAGPVQGALIEEAQFARVKWSHL